MQGMQQDSALTIRIAQPNIVVAHWYACWEGSANGIWIDQMCITQNNIVQGYYRRGNQVLTRKPA